MSSNRPSKPSVAFVGASWAALLIGMTTYLIGLWNASNMQLNEKGYYFAVLILGLYAAVSLQKTVRDSVEGIPVTRMYLSISWVALGIAIALLTIGLINATISPSEKGFYGMSFALSLFASIAVQKNVRDTAAAEGGVARFSGANHDSN